MILFKILQNLHIKATMSSKKNKEIRLQILASISSQALKLYLSCSISLAQYL